MVAGTIAGVALPATGDVLETPRCCVIVGCSIQSYGKSARRHNVHIVAGTIASAAVPATGDVLERRAAAR